MQDRKQDGLAAVVGFVGEDVVEEPAAGELGVFPRPDVGGVVPGRDDLMGTGTDLVVLCEEPGEWLGRRPGPRQIVLLGRFGQEPGQFFLGTGLPRAYLVQPVGFDIGDVEDGCADAVATGERLPEDSFIGDSA